MEDVLKPTLVNYFFTSQSHSSGNNTHTPLKTATAPPLPLPALPLKKKKRKKKPLAVVPDEEILPQTGTAVNTSALIRPGHLVFSNCLLSEMLQLLPLSR